MLTIANYPSTSRELATLGTRAVSALPGNADVESMKLVEYTAPPHFSGVAPHCHARMNEAFYVVEGRLLVEIGGEVIDATAGSLVTIPAKVTHCWSNPDEEPTRLLVVSAPGRFEDYVCDALEASASIHFERTNV